MRFRLLRIDLLINCDTYAKVGNNDQLPTEITALIGKNYAFKVSIDDYNLKKLLPVFTVLRLSDDPEILNSIRLAVTPIKVLDEWTFTARLINGHDYCYSNPSNLVIQLTWMQPMHSKPKVINMELIIIDEQGAKMHAMVRMALFPMFKQQLNEGDGLCCVTDIAQKDKNKAKRTKPSMGMERV
ncbi:hypothetical protein Tco_0278526 [Tanacetum coccineum]